MNLTERRLVFVQYAGDYREAFQRLAQQGGETYYAQKYSVDAVTELASQADSTTVICCMTETLYDEQLSNGVRAVGAGFSGRIDNAKLLRLVAAQKPTHLVLRYPSSSLLSWAVRHKVKILVTLADSFSSKGLRSRVSNYQLAKLLNHPQVSWVGNHNLNASMSLKSIGVNPDKIIPWDWPSLITPSAFAPKKLESRTTPYQLLYVGAVSAAKGVGDILNAIQRLKANNVPVILKVAGKGDLSTFQQHVFDLKIESLVEFLGLVPQPQVVTLMRDSDLVVIPSRHEYPEGLPMTIYEALCSRTPIVASDHPMFCDKLQQNVSAAIFPAANPDALAKEITRLLSDPALYERLSLQSEYAWEQLQIPVKWAELVRRWLIDQPEDRQWLSSYRLNSIFYTDPDGHVSPSSGSDASQLVSEAMESWAPRIGDIVPELQRASRRSSILSSTQINNEKPELP